MVRRKVIWSNNVLNDKFKIYDFWYRKNGSSDYSKKLENEFRNITKVLSRFNYSGKIYPGSDSRFIIKDYFQIFYSINEDYIEINQIWDTRQNPKSLPL